MRGVLRTRQEGLRHGYTPFSWPPGLCFVCPYNIAPHLMFGGASRLAATQSQWNPTKTARKPYENCWRNAKTVKTGYLKKRKNTLFFENTVFTVFAFLQQFSFGFRAVFVGFRQCGCDLFLFRYPKICPPRCVRAFACFLANRRRLCRGNGQPSLSCVVTWVVPVA